jgi:hypothetical protein
LDDQENTSEESDLQPLYRHTTERHKMTDKELLEMSAKAAEIQIVGEVDKMIGQPDHKTGGYVIRNDRGGDSCWNPLTDDGDALRLAVKLEMMIDYIDRGYMAGHVLATTGPAMLSIYEPREQYPYVATRRAITRAAAEIGKAMKS